MMYQLKAILLVLLYRYVQAQDANCDFTQYVAAGRQYYVYSPGYPGNYTPGVQCRWIGICPANSSCRLDCGLIDLPQTSSCYLDRLLISRSGDPQLAAAEYYCGRGALSVVSTGQRISVGLITTRRTSGPSGGRFICTLTAQQPVNISTQCNCGQKKMNRIVGGQPTKPNEYPAMAGLVYSFDNTIKCGATIIDRRYVITAAHCVVRRTAQELGIIVGEYDTSTGSDSPSTQGFQVKYYQIHPQYNPSTQDYDIAILELDGYITYSDNVGPICLPFKFASYDFAGENVTILGWGTTESGGPVSKVLRQVNVDVISQATCRRSVPSLTPRQICTLTPGKDACQNDSGGPLLYTDPDTELLFHVGIVSFGRFCGSTDPAINTRTTALLDWIVRTAPANYCRK